MDGNVPRSASCGIDISQLIRFAGVSCRMADFGARGGVLAAGLLQRGRRCDVSWTLESFFLNFITDTMNWFLNSRSD